MANLTKGFGGVKKDGPKVIFIDFVLSLREKKTGRATERALEDGEAPIDQSPIAF
jgi:hypothetical protein